MLFAKLPPDVAHAVPADQLVRQQELCSEALRSVIQRESIMDGSHKQFSAVFVPPAERIEALMLPQEWAELCVTVNGSASSGISQVSASALAEYAVHQLFLTGMFMHNLCLKSSDQAFGRERLGVFQTAIRNETQSATQSIRRTEDVAASLFGAKFKLQLWLALSFCIVSAVPSGAVLLATGALASVSDALLAATLLCSLPCLAAMPWLVMLNTHALSAKLTAGQHSKPLFAFHRPLFSMESLQLPLLEGGSTHHSTGPSTNSSPLRSPILLSPASSKKASPEGGLLQQGGGGYTAPQIPPFTSPAAPSPSGRPPRAPGTPSALLMPPLDEVSTDGEDCEDEDEGGFERYEGGSTTTPSPLAHQHCCVPLGDVLGVPVHRDVETVWSVYLRSGAAPLDMGMVLAAAGGAWCADAEAKLRHELHMGTQVVWSAFQAACEHRSAHQLATQLAALATGTRALTPGSRGTPATGEDLEATILESPPRRASRDGSASDSQYSGNSNPLDEQLSTPSTATSQAGTRSSAGSPAPGTLISTKGSVSTITPSTGNAEASGGGARGTPAPPSTPGDTPAESAVSGCGSTQPSTPAAVLTPAAGLAAVRAPGAAWTVGRSLALRRAITGGGGGSAAAHSADSLPAFATPGRQGQRVLSPAHVAAVTSPDGSPTWAQAALGLAPLPAMAPRSTHSGSPSPRRALSPLASWGAESGRLGGSAGAAPRASAAGYVALPVASASAEGSRGSTALPSPQHRLTMPRIALDFGAGGEGGDPPRHGSPQRRQAEDTVAPSPLSHKDVSAARATSMAGSLNSVLGTPQPPLGMAARPTSAAPSPARNIAQQNTSSWGGALGSLWSSAFAAGASILAPESDGGAAANAAQNTLDYVAAAAAAAEGMQRPNTRGTGRWAQTGGTAFGSPPAQWTGDVSAVAGGGAWGETAPLQVQAALDASALGSGLASP